MSRAILLLALLLSACDRPAPQAGKARAAAPVGDTASLAGDAGGGRIGFAPLKSAAVKEAIYRAMASGEAQRWQDGTLTGYAVPGAQGWKGCRAVRFTIDQVPDAAPGQINACR